MAQELLKMLIDKNIKVKKFIADEISLHDIFIEVTGNVNIATKEAANV
jgi:ABC-type uncharacterized transport system ATPase subunit